MRYNITRLVNEIMLYEREIQSLEGELKSHRNSEKVNQELNYQLNSKRHAKSLCYSHIGQETVQRMKEGKSLDDIHELEDWEDIKALPMSSISKNKARGLIANAVKIAERVGYRVEYLIKEN